MKSKDVVEEHKATFAKTHNGITCVFQLPEVIEKTKVGNRKRAWRCIVL